MNTKKAFSWLIGEQEQGSDVVTWEQDSYSGNWQCIVQPETNIEAEIKFILTRYRFTEEDKPLLTDYITAYITSLNSLRAANKRRERTRGTTNYELDYLLEHELRETRGQLDIIQHHEHNIEQLVDFLHQTGYTKRHTRKPPEANLSMFRTDGQDT